ncbi:MAG TPA: PEP-CTERM sorting domain-containing protein [Bryobacteraceae bacterium]|nr:PEP-CTERM sorting domain-containing protein [Bryobacteraceae bacterium]
MRGALLTLVLGATICPASTLLDTFNQPQTNCNYSITPPYGVCDVIGEEMLFDIQMANVSINEGTATVTLYFNTGGVTTVHNQLTLGGFTTAGDELMIGDLFFYNPNTVYDPANPSTAQYLRYGVPLQNHGSFIAGNLYDIAGGIGTETAQQALNDNSDYYRRNEVVLMDGTGSAAATGDGVRVASFGNGTSNALYAVTVSFPVTSDFMSLVADSQIGILFSSADCGNDVIQGAALVSPTPEPPPAVLMLAGVGLLGVVLVWRKRTGKAAA